MDTNLTHVRTLPQENGHDIIEITPPTPPQKFVVHGRLVSVNGREELLYIQGNYPNIGYPNERSKRGDETILHVRRATPSQIIEDSITNRKIYIPGPDALNTPEVAGTSLSYGGKHTLIYLKGPYPELGEIHTNGYSGIETIVRILPEFTLIPINPTQFENIRMQFGDIPI